MKTCKNCINRYRDNMGVSYCKVQKDNKTFNGLKKIKASSLTCVLYSKR